MTFLFDEAAACCNSAFTPGVVRTKDSFGLGSGGGYEHLSD